MLTDAQKAILTPLADKLNALRDQDQKIADSAAAYQWHPGAFPVGFEAGLLKDATRIKAALKLAEAEYRATWDSLNIPLSAEEQFISEDEAGMRRVVPNWNGKDSQVD